MVSKVGQPVVLAVLGLVAVIIVCAAVLGATGNPIPDWFKDLATLLAGGALGAYQQEKAAPLPPAGG